MVRNKGGKNPKHPNRRPSPGHKSGVDIILNHDYNPDKDLARTAVFEGKRPFSLPAYQS
ncbi:MAG: hypothetical protein R3E31_20135 [Chloroflexota bacterium]